MSTILIYHPSQEFLAALQERIAPINPANSTILCVQDASQLGDLTIQHKGDVRRTIILSCDYMGMPEYGQERLLRLCRVLNPAVWFFRLTARQEAAGCTDGVIPDGVSVRRNELIAFLSVNFDALNTLQDLYRHPAVPWLRWTV